MDGLASAIASRDIATLRESLGTVLKDVPGLRVGLPESLTAQSDQAKQFVAAAKEAVATCRAKAGGPRCKGAFSVLIVTPAAPRAASLCGVLSRGGVLTAKLFGRHMEIEEQTVFLANHFVDVAVGTPHRIAQLAEAAALDLSALRCILVDCTADEKEQHFFTRPPEKTGLRRRPDADELAGMLNSETFAVVLQHPKRAPMLCPVLCPTKAALEAATPVGQRFNGRGRAKGGGGRGGKGEGGARGAGKGVGRGGANRGRGPIRKRSK